MTSYKLLYIINVDWYFMLHWLDRANAAKKAGYEVHIVMGLSQECHRETLEKLDFIVHDIPLSRKNLNPPLELRTIRAIHRIILQQKPDLIHSVTIKPNIYAGILCRFHSIKNVASITGLGTTLSSDKGRVLAITSHGIKYLYRIAFGGRQCQVLFENRDDLELMVSSNIIKRQQCTYIPGAGVNTTLYRTRTEPPPPVKILFAARLLKNKGLLDLVEAVQHIKAHNDSSVELLVAGIVDNDAHGTIPIPQLEKWQDQGLIRWLGQIDDMPNLIQNVHIICLPTQYGEGVPRILIEGAACGKPLVATNVQGCREIIIDGENGILVTPGNKEELISALQRLIGDPDTRAAMGHKGRKHVENQYSDQIVISKTLEIYKQCLGSQIRK